MFEKESQYYAFDEVKHKQEWYIKHPEHSIDCDYDINDLKETIYRKERELVKLEERFEKELEKETKKASSFKL